MSAWGKQLTADPQDNQHHGFLPGGRGGDRSLLRPLNQDHEGHLWWLRRDEYKGLISKLKEQKFSHLVFSLCYPHGVELFWIKKKNESCKIIHNGWRRTCDRRSRAGRLASPPPDLTFQRNVNSLQYLFPKAKPKTPLDSNWHTTRWRAWATKTLRNTSKGTRHTWAQIQLKLFLMLATKAVGMVLLIKNVEALQDELRKDYIITQELSNLFGYLVLKGGGQCLALANATLITIKHIDFNTLLESKDEAKSEEIPEQSTPTAE